MVNEPKGPIEYRERPEAFAASPPPPEPVYCLIHAEYSVMAWDGRRVGAMCCLTRDGET